MPFAAKSSSSPRILSSVVVFRRLSSFSSAFVRYDGAAGNGLGTTIKYLRAAAGIGLGTTIKYLRGAAGNGLGSTMRYLRRATNGAASNG